MRTFESDLPQKQAGPCFVWPFQRYRLCFLAQLALFFILNCKDCRVIADFDSDFPR
jgi:hypothetical protein